MSGITWTKFFWSDWQSDPALRLCSYAARGLWMDMLCIAAAHDPIGYVAVAGRGLDETAIARMTGGSESEVASLLGELDRNGVFSRDRHGRIYSRRMVADAKKAAIARKFGKEGGNPKLMGGYNKPGFVYLIGVRRDGAYKIGISNNPQNRLTKIRAQYPGQDLSVLDAWPVDDMGAREAEAHALFADKRSGEWFFLNGVDVGKIRAFFATLKGGEMPPLKPQKPEAMSQMISVPDGTVSPADDAPLQDVLFATRPAKPTAQEVDAIWALQPVIRGKRRSSRPDVETALTAAYRRGRRFEDIAAGCGAYYALEDSQREDGQFAMGAHRLIERDRWREFVAAPEQPRSARWGPAEWRAAMQLYAETGRWKDTLGPMPGEPGCRVPPQIAAEFSPQPHTAH